MTVTLPDTGDGSRRRRREERKRRGGRVLLRLIGVVVLLAVLGAVGWFVLDLVTGEDGEPDGAEVATAPTTVAPTDGPGLLVLVDDGGDVYGVTVFQPATDAVVHVPSGTLLEVASMGLVSLREANADGGTELLRHSLENLLGVRFAAAVAVTAEDLAALSPDLVVTVGEPVEERDAGGRVVEVVPAGELVVDATTIGPLLQSVGDGTALDRIVRHQAFWTAFLAAGVDSPLEALDELDADAQQRILPVEAVAGLDGDDELYRVVDEDVVAMVGRLFPGAPRGGADRIRVRILNGAGAPGVAQQVQPLLVDAGGRMTLSGNADRFDYETTQIVYYDDEGLADAEAIRAALGVGEIVKSLADLDVVDVTVVVGADFLASRTGG